MNYGGNALECLARRLELHVAITPEDRAALLGLPFTQKRLDPSTYLVRDGDPPKTCAVLLSGFAYRQKTTGDGCRSILSLHIPGEALDFQNLFLNVADHNLQTLTHAEVAVIPRDAVREIARSRPGIAHAILIYTLVEASISREWVLNVSRRDARARTAHLLCELAIRVDPLCSNDDRAYDLPMTQEQLGDALGLTAVHVNRTLKNLEANGLIERDRRTIRFPAWESLRDVADFNARYLHLERQPS